MDDLDRVTLAAAGKADNTLMVFVDDRGLDSVAMEGALDLRAARSYVGREVKAVVSQDRHDRGLFIRLQLTSHDWVLQDFENHVSLCLVLVKRSGVGEGEVPAIEQVASALVQEERVNLVVVFRVQLPRI